MPPTSDPTDPPRLQDSNKVPLGIANVFRSLGGRLNRGSSLSTPAAPLASGGNRSSLPEYLSEEAAISGKVLVDKLQANNSLSDRLTAAEALRTIIADYPISTVAEIWANAQDLIDEENPPEARQAALNLLTACIKQYEPSSLDRIKLYRTIASHNCPEDFFHQLQALRALTSGGRDLSTFQGEIGVSLSKWLKAWFKESTIARQARKRERGSHGNPSSEEFCLKELFQFTTDIIKFNFKSFEEREVNQLLTDVLSICRKTTSKKDIECSIAFIEALITYGYVPRPALKPCIEVLCGSYATLRDLTDATWSAISNLCRSYMAHNSIMVLREILDAPAKNHSASNNTNTLRGAVWFLEKLLIANEKDGLPSVQFAVVMSAFQSALAADSMRLELEVTRAIAAILASKDIASQIAFDDWPVPLEILVHCSRRASRIPNATIRDANPGTDETLPSQAYETDGLGVAISQALLQIINLLEAVCLNPEFEPSEVIDFFVRVHEHLPNSTAQLVINYYSAEHLCYPSCGEWLGNCRRLLDIFFKTRSRPALMRTCVLLLMRDVYETIRDVSENAILHALVMSVFEDFQSEQDLKVLEEMVKLAVDVAGDSAMKLFESLLGLLVGYIEPEGGLPDLPLPGQGGAGAKSSACVTSSVRGPQVNIVTRGLVRIFIRNMNTNAAKTAQVYERLVAIAGSTVLEPHARLTAMRLLFRLRADSGNAIFIVDKVESDHLASALHRVAKVVDETSSIASRAGEESSSSSRSNRSNSVSLSVSQSVSQSSFLFKNSGRSMTEKYDRPKRKPQIWSYPEPNMLPEKPTHGSSPIICTFYDPPADFSTREGPSLDPQTCIRMSLWMEKVIPIIQQGCDWEIYSYVLVHLSSQLSNKTAFRNCKAHINMLRSYVCDQLHTNKIPNTDLPAEVKKADIAVVLINLLTTLISYKQHFAKNETEGIVKAFQLGLHSWQRTAKPCIHALSICCYELPGSTSKFLPGILTKLSQIITSSAVSVHILEFLSALAKLPKLYSNFTEPDFRNVFGIAFRYIQHTKETTAQQPSRVSYPSRANQVGTADLTMQAEQPDLPQYVLTLAYHVLTTWFLSLRLSERPKYVSWITRGLVLHDQSNFVDEQSQACIDMLQRFTYSDNDLKPPNKIDPQTPGVVTKNWLHGSSILTVQTAPDSGISRIVVRRASGTSYYTLKPASRDLHSMLQSKWVNIPDDIASLADASAGVETNHDRVLPSHFLLQFVGGLGVPEQVRPILLPEDEKTYRALDVFDRIPIVDFHKVGVVYVGAGQTEERDILSNTMGSPDFTDFIDGLGDLIKLEGTDRNTGGLDRVTNLDGEFAFFWSDRITEIIFHITTMMPTTEGDYQCTMKKRHIGNDFVNIVFNNSGLPWRFGTVPSQFNFVTIIITPEARSGFVSARLLKKGPQDSIFYRVQMVCKEGFSEISPAQETKIVSDASLPAFVRNLALNASVYSHVYNEGGGEHVSNWRHRLRSIKRLRERTAVTSPGPVGGPISAGGTSPLQNPAAPGSRRVSTMSAQTSASDHNYRNSVQVNGDVDRDFETEDLLVSLDFSRFT